jgi:hypothetical protein
MGIGISKTGEREPGYGPSGGGTGLLNEEAMRPRPVPVQRPTVGQYLQAVRTYRHDPGFDMKEPMRAIAQFHSHAFPTAPLVVDSMFEKQSLVSGDS